VKTKGQIVVLSSGAAQYRTALYSEYCLSKHALNRLAELVVVGTYPSSRKRIGESYLLTAMILTENPSIRIFCVHPGCVETQLITDSQSAIPCEDPLALPAATILYLTSGKADYLSSRYVSATWDLSEVERDWKEKIVAQNSLVNKLAIPH
jgi:NAD(P)-dependent dehydrogenase (short-subunit alcohol dehydrogenase family)